MDIFCTVKGQKLHIDTPLNHVAWGSNDFVRFLFSLSDDWDGLNTFVQFRQWDKTFNRYLESTYVEKDGESKHYMAAGLPLIPEPGPMTMTLYGTGEDNVIATTDTVCIPVTDTGYMGNGSSTDIPETLYQQLADRVANVEKRFDDTVIGDVDATIFFPHVPQTEESGLCCVIQRHEHAILIDLNGYDSSKENGGAYAYVKAEMKSRGIKSIDMILLTHWHVDHTSFNGQNANNGWAHWKQDFDCSRTIVYYPPAITAASDMYDTRQTLPSDSHGRPVPLFRSFPNSLAMPCATDGEDITWNGIKLRCYNISDEDYAYYNSISEGYNAYSAIIYVETGNFRLCVTGDILAATEKRARDCGYLLPSTVVTAPHHGLRTLRASESSTLAGYSVYVDAMQILNPRVYYIPDNYRMYYYAHYVYEAFSISRTAMICDNNNGGLEMSIGPSGFYYTARPMPANSLSYSSHKVIHVDESNACDENDQPSTALMSYQDGSAEHPYTSLAYALTQASGFTRIFLHSDTLTYKAASRLASIGICEGANIEIIGDKGSGVKPTINEKINVYPGGRLRIVNVTLSDDASVDMGQLYCKNVTLLSVTANRAIVTLENVVFTTTTESHCITADDSFVTVNGITAASVSGKHVAYCQRCVFDISISVSDINSQIGVPFFNLTQCSIGSTLLSKNWSDIRKYFSLNNTLPVMFDTTTGTERFIKYSTAGSGTLFYASASSESVT